MKKMNCRQLGGACELEFHAETFEDMAELSRQHGMEMHRQQDAQHLDAMRKMQELINNPEDMQKWFDAKRAEFEALPDVEAEA